LQRFLLFGALGAAFSYLIEDVLKLIAKKNRDDRRRGFVGAQAMVVRGSCNDCAQQPAPSMDHTNDGRAEHQELRVRVRRVAGVEQIALGRIAKREIDVFAGTIDARERFLVQQAYHPVLLGDALQHDHGHLLMVGREVAVFENGR